MRRTPHAFLWLLTLGAQGFEVFCFAAIGWQWPPLQPGPLSPVTATAIAVALSLMLTYVLWRLLRWGHPHPYIRAALQVTAITAFASVVGTIAFAASWTDTIAMALGALPARLATGAMIVGRRRRDEAEVWARRDRA